jgi:hypothetical protein
MDQTTELDFRDDPFSSPAWRWLRASCLAEQGRRASPRRDDERVREALRFCREMRRSLHERGLSSLARRMPTLYQAWCMFQDSSQRRWECEARLLAGQSTPAIADRCGLPGEVVDNFHDLFFAVRPHLEARDWIMNRVIGRKAHVGLQQSDKADLLRLYGFLGGPMVIDDLLDYLAHPPRMPRTLDGLDERALSDLKHRLAIRAALLARSLNVDEAGLRRLLVLRDRCESERRNDHDEVCHLVDRVLSPSAFDSAPSEPSVVMPTPKGSVIHPLWLLWSLEQAA